MSNIDNAWHSSHLHNIMSNIDNASQTNQSMILHLSIKVDINDNQIVNNLPLCYWWQPSKTFLLPLWMYSVFWVLWDDFVLLFISPPLTTMKKGIFVFSPWDDAPPEVMLLLRWFFPCFCAICFGLCFTIYLSPCQQFSLFDY